MTFVLRLDEAKRVENEIDVSKLTFSSITRRTGVAGASPPRAHTEFRLDTTRPRADEPPSPRSPLSPHRESAEARRARQARQASGLGSAAALVVAVASAVSGSAPAGVVATALVALAFALAAVGAHAAIAQAVTILSVLVVADADTAVGGLLVGLLLAAGGARESRHVLLVLLFFSVAQSSQDLSERRQHAIWWLSGLSALSWSGEGVVPPLVWPRVTLTVLALGFYA